MAESVTRPRVLLVTRNLPPLVGGMERLNWHMADELKNYAEVRIIGPTGAAALKPTTIALSEAPLKPLPLFLIVAMLTSIWIALRWRPDVILAGTGLTAPMAWLASKLCGARSAAYLHGLDITAKNHIYQWLWRPIFKKLDQIIVNSTPTRELALAADVDPERLAIVHPGVSIPDTPQSAERVVAFREQHGLAGKNILLSVGRLTARKGLMEFIEHALPSIVRAEPNSVLVVIGEAPKNSLAAGHQSVESLQAQAHELGISSHLKFLGTISDDELATAYEAADLHVFPVRHIPSDPEGFGMVAVEAAAHGLPTVAFATGGVIDAVKHGKSGQLVAPQDYEALAAAVTATLTESRQLRLSCMEFAHRFAWPHIGEQLSDHLHLSQSSPSGSK